MTAFESDLIILDAELRSDDLAEHTRNQYIRELERWHEWAVEQGHKSFTQREVRAYLAQVREHRGVNNEAMACRALKRYSKFVANLDGTADQLAGLKYRQTPKTPSKATAARVEDVEAMVATCSTDSFRDVRDKALILVLACSGMRRAEVCGMTWGTIDRRAGMVSLLMTKNGDARNVGLSQEALVALLRYERRIDRLEMEIRREIDTWQVWWGRGRPLTPSGITQIIQARALAAGVTVTAHSFRRAFAIAWLKRGGSESYLRSVCGWRSAEMVKRYTSSVINDEAIAMQRRLFG